MVKCSLPKIINISNLKKESIEIAYKIYLDEISNNTCLKFQNLPVKVSKKIDCDFREQTFEHIVSRDMKARLFDLNRLNKISWIKYIITCCSKECSNYVILNEKNRKNDYVIWCKKENYVIVLELRVDKITHKKFFYLKTAYPVIYKDKLEQLKKKEKRQNENDRN